MVRTMELEQRLPREATARSPGSTSQPRRGLDTASGARSHGALSRGKALTCILCYDFGPRSPSARRFLTTFIPLAHAHGRARSDTEDADHRDRAERIEARLRLTERRSTGRGGLR